MYFVQNIFIAWGLIFSSHSVSIEKIPLLGIDLDCRTHAHIIVTINSGIDYIVFIWFFDTCLPDKLPDQ